MQFAEYGRFPSCLSILCWGGRLMCDMLDMSNYRALSACVIDTPDSFVLFLFINIETYLCLFLPLLMEYCLMIPRLCLSNTFHRIRIDIFLLCLFCTNYALLLCTAAVCDSYTIFLSSVIHADDFTDNAAINALGIELLPHSFKAREVLRSISSQPQKRKEREGE